MKSVSVLIPNFNGRQHLETCLGSLQGQLHRAHEVLVFDNGSNDGSVELLRQKFPSVCVIASSKNFGFAGALNRAAQHANGEWLAFLNNDMRTAADWIQAAMLHSDRHPCIASRMLNWSGDKLDFDGASLQYLGFAEQVGRGEPNTSAAIAGPILFPCGGAMFIRKDLFLEVGGFDEDYFAVYEDVDLGWRLWLEGHQIFFEPNSTVYHKGHATLDSRREEKKRYLMHRNAMFTIIKNYQQDAFQRILPVAFLQAVRRAVRFAGIDKKTFYFWEDTEIPQNSASLWMWKDAINHLVALDDVIENWHHLMEKRQRVQARRKRADCEIFPLFRDPFRRIFKDANYEEHEAEWITALGITQLFCETVPFSLTREFHKDLKREIQELRRELSHLGSQLHAADCAEKRQPARIDQLARRFFRRWVKRSCGP
ncbi:MAG: glycosyltransferase family 2 protein [Acidobacteria bacterium]|nr:glycosyltransferase family 2 protein [Acidobacteriota bacterium]